MSKQKSKSVKNVAEDKKSNEELLRRETITKLYPSILQITSICFKDSESHVRQAKPTVRCVHDIQIRDLVREIILKEWKLKSPRIVVLVMSNVGPIHNWTNTKQIKSFQKGLMNAVENTNMWLITNGIDIGATTIIGNAISDYMTEAKYKRQTNRDKTFSKFNFIGVAEEDRLKHLHSFIDSEQQKIEMPTEMQEKTNKFNLNRNLSHYILIRDQSLDKNGVNTFLSEFIQYLSLSQNQTSDTSLSKSKEDLQSIETNEVPVVSLIIKGGYGCARLVLKQIRNDIPIVVLRGSGGLADLLAFVDIEIRDRSLNVWNPEFVETYLKPELTIKILEMFPKLQNNSLLCDQFRHRILESVRQSRKEGQNYLTIINMFDKYSCNLENLTEYLLLALFRSQRTEPVDSVSSHIKSELEPKPPTQQMIRKDLNLCVDWNCPEMAKKEVLSKDPTFELSSEKSLFESSLIRPNRWQFVDLFLSQKFKLRTFVLPKRLLKMFRKLHFRDFFSTVCWETILGRSLDFKQSDRFLDRELNWLIEACTGIKGYVDEDELDLFITEQYPESEKEAERKALGLLVFWAIFDFRQKLVRILWRHSDQPIHLALIIAMAYDRLSWYTAEEVLSLRLKEESKLFVTFACEMLDIIYKESAFRAEQILNESTKDWNYYTPVDLAAFGKFRAFFSHESCQRWLTLQTYGNIVVREVRCGLFRMPSMFKLLLSSYLVFPSFLWIRIPNYKTDQSIQRRDYFDDDDSDNENPLEIYLNRNDYEYEEQKTPELKKIKNKMRSKASLLGKRQELNEKMPRPPIHTMVYEVWTAPITKFWNFQFFYTFYLSIFSAAVLFPRCGHTGLDFVVIVWTALIVVDSIRQNYLKYKRNTKYSIIIHVIEIIFQITFLLFYTYGRLISKDTSWPPFDPYMEKVLMCLALIHAYYVLFTVFLPISATLGPLLYRLRIMILVDFLNFIRLSILVMISFGIVLQAILYPDLSIDYNLFRTAFHRAFFSMFRSFDSDLLVDKECESKYRWDQQNTTNPSKNSEHLECSASIYNEEKCRVIGFWPYFLYIAYYILLKLILMTLLYAIFASSATRLTADTDSIWKFQRYGMVMDFVTRAPLPPPLNIFYYVYWIFRLISGFCFKCFPNKTENKTFSFFPEIQQLMSPKTFVTKHSKLLADEDYTYLRILASEVYDNYEEKVSSESTASQQFERVKANSEELEYQRRTLRQLKGKMSEMERSIRQTYTCLELIKHMTTKKLGIDNSGHRTPHVFSRHTPYPHTSTQRFPVPDKYVPWTVMLIDYDPTIYTKPKEEFSSNLQQYVDVDVLAILSEGNSGNKVPVLEYNRISVSGGGVTIDRSSWEKNEDNQINIYKLNNGIPVNPFGRTGMRGRGSLLRWGPNHYIMLVITRDYGKDNLQVLVEKANPKTNLISLIVRFIPSEITYKQFESLFKTETSEHNNWTESQKMIDFFTSFDKNAFPKSNESMEQSTKITFKYETLTKGYFDDPLNTDQAWKEIELWHFHYYNQAHALNDCINDSLEWRSVTETFFSALTLSQSNVIQVIADKLKARIH